MSDNYYNAETLRYRVATSCGVAKNLSLQKPMPVWNSGYAFVTGQGRAKRGSNEGQRASKAVTTAKMKVGLQVYRDIMHCWDRHKARMDNLRLLSREPKGFGTSVLTSRLLDMICRSTKVQIAMGEAGEGFPGTYPRSKKSSS